MSNVSRPLASGVALAAIVIAAGVSLYVHTRFEKEPPNYNEIEAGLFLGGRVPAPPPGTRAVLNLCELEDDYEVEIQRFSPISDAAPAPPLMWLRQQVEFIEEQRRPGQPTYVHCFAGVSRGAMVVAAYEMKQHDWSRDQALDFLRTRRGVINPNPAFRQLLLEWEKALKQ